MKKLFLIAAILLMGGISAFADEPLSLVVRSASGAEREFSAVGLTLRFNEGSLIVSNNSSSEEFAIDSLDRMFFGKATNGVMQITPDARSLPATVYSADGILIGSFGSLNDALEQLPEDLYIIVQGEKSFKLLVK